MSSVRLFKCASVIGVFAVTVAAQAAFYSQNLNPTQDIPAVSDYQTTGEDMAGMAVTFHFETAASETVIWAAGAPGSGSAAGVDGDVVLSQGGDSFSNPWLLTYNLSPAKGRLTGFSIDGFAAGPGEVGVMFDRTFGGMFGTPGSFKGRDFEVVGPEPFDVLVDYVGGIGVAAAAPVGDEFRWLNVDFRLLGTSPDEFNTEPPQIAGLDGVNLRTLEFYQDTNNPIVPEPTAAVMILTCGLLLRRR